MGLNGVASVQLYTVYQTRSEAPEVASKDLNLSFPLICSAPALYEAFASVWRMSLDSFSRGLASKLLNRLLVRLLSLNISELAYLKPRCERS